MKRNHSVIYKILIKKMPEMDEIIIKIVYDYIK